MQFITRKDLDPFIDKLIDEMNKKISARIFNIQTTYSLLQKDFDDKSIDILEFSVRTHTCLKQAGINTISELARKTENDLLKLKNFGRKSLYEVKELLSNHNLSLNMNEQNFVNFTNYISELKAMAQNEKIN
jgi:DNA-directed RNA polymerase alpha subunit